MHASWPPSTGRWLHSTAGWRSARPLVAPLRIPFEDTSLPADLIPAADAPNAVRPLILFTNGYDASITDMYFASAVAASRRGYHALLFDGAGQGEALIRRGIKLRPDWETVIGAVIDVAVTLPQVDVKRIVLSGWSLGGYLATRAATGEPRLAACIADPGLSGMTDGVRAMVARMGAALRCPKTQTATHSLRCIESCHARASKARHGRARVDPQCYPHRMWITLRRWSVRCRQCVVVLAIAALPATSAIASPLAADPDVIANALRGQRVILFGEVHDNAVQHALRLATLQRLIANGARPALAFEQFDRGHQADIDRARREHPRDGDYLIAQASDARAGWNWAFYRPYLELALVHDLPIVAANLSRSDAMKVATQGWPSVFPPAKQSALQLDALPRDLRDAHERAVATGHCDLLPASALPAMANAQIARDVTMAEAIAPYVEQGVVLLAGNGHVRRDIGVVRWLPPAAAKAALSVGLLERTSDDPPARADIEFDRHVLTDSTDRPDPCRDLAKRLPRLPAR
jgi:uncharacterized iron-regulated protein